MKTIKFNSELNLNKKTITKLHDSQLSQFKGGAVVEVLSQSCYLMSCAGDKEEAIQR